MKKHSFLFFFSRKMMSALLLRFKANFSKKNAWLHPFFFSDSNSFCKDLRFLHGANLVHKPPYLVGTVLRESFFVPSSKSEKLNVLKIVCFSHWPECSPKRCFYPQSRM